MTSVIPFRTVPNQASEWLVRLRSDHVTEDDRRQFEAWAAAHPAHREAYNRIAATWRRLELLKLANGQRGTGTNVSSSRRYWRAAAAASALLCISAAGYFALESRSKIYSTETGEQRRIVLADTSAVELNTRSKLSVDFKPHERIVILEHGEARFKVAPDRERPFIVKAGDSLIRVVGTEFNVRVAEKGVEVLVVEGAISFVPGGQAPASPPLMVRAGHVASSAGRSSTLPVAVAPEMVERELAWRNGMVSFRGETLREVLAELSRYNSVRFTLDDEAAANIQVSGYFRTTDVPTFLRRLESNFPVQVRQEGREVTIASRSEP